ncbi:MAG: hypothetical protein ACQEP2_07435 [Actinomycetota bacterium]
MVKVSSPPALSFTVTTISAPRSVTEPSTFSGDSHDNAMLSLVILFVSAIAPWLGQC